MFEFWNHMITYFSQHVMLNSWAHACAGFGLALLLQQYLKGNAFAPSWLAWGLVAISAIIHLMAVMG